MTLINLFRHISIRRLHLQKAQTFMTLAGICLGVSAVVSIGIINKSVLKSFEDSINRVTGRAALSMLLGLVGGGLGVASGLLLGWMTLEGFFRADYGGSAKLYIPYFSVVWALVLSAALAGLAGMYPARRAAKTNIIDAMAYE